MREALPYRHQNEERVASLCVLSACICSSESLAAVSRRSLPLALPLVLPLALPPDILRCAVPCTTLLRLLVWASVRVLGRVEQRSSGGYWAQVSAEGIRGVRDRGGVI